MAGSVAGKGAGRGGLRKVGAVWYYRFVDEHGLKRERAGTPDRRVTESLRRAAINRAERVRAGLVDERAEGIVEAARSPIAAHLADYRADLIASGATTTHANLTATRAGRVVALVRGATLAEIDPPRTANREGRAVCTRVVAAKLTAARWGDLDKGKVQRALAALRDAGRSLQTVNHHRAAFRAFCRWAVDQSPPRLTASSDPSRGVVGFNAKEDRRHDRRTVSTEEFRRLVASAEAGPPYRKMTGPTRALVYRLAATTGLRFKELARLGPTAFHLNDPPTVTALAAYTKNRDDATFPLTPDLTLDLRAYLDGKPADRPAFPLPISAEGKDGKGAVMLRLDLAAAGIPYRDAAGLVFDFHSTRCEHATLLDLAGVSPRVIQRKMRHSTLELTGRYTRHRDADLDAATAALPDLRPVVAEGERIRNRREVAHHLPTTGDSPGRAVAGLDAMDDGMTPAIPLRNPLAVADFDARCRVSSGFDGVRPAGFEPATDGLENRCSIH